MIQPTIAEIEGALGDLIFGSGEDELEHAVSRMLLERQMTLASVEVGASSLFPRLDAGSNDQSGRYYAGGLAFADLQSAMNWLGGTSTVFDQAACAQLASLARERFRSSLAVAFGI